MPLRPGPPRHPHRPPGIPPLPVARLPITPVPSTSGVPGPVAAAAVGSSFLARWAARIVAMADLFDFGDADIAMLALAGGHASSHAVGTGAQPTSPSTGAQPRQPTTGAPPTPPATDAQPTPTKAGKRARDVTPSKIRLASRVVRAKNHVGARLHCTAVTGPAATLQCIYVPAPSQREGKQQPKQPVKFPVPLWPTYILAGAPTDKAEVSWLLFGHNENWIARIVALSVKARHGERARLVVALRNAWVSRFQAALKAARKMHFVDDSEQDDSGVQDDDSRENVTAPTTITYSKQVCYEVDVEGHTMTVVNSLRPIVLQLDHRTIAFLNAHVVPSVATLAHSQPMCSPTVAPKPPAPFTFRPDQLRNIRSKVVWVPTAHMWKLEVAKPKTTLEDSKLFFRVPPSSTKADYMTAKIDAYIKAIRFWNAMDGSSRSRIRVPLLGDKTLEEQPSGGCVRAEESGRESDYN